MTFIKPYLLPQLAHCEPLTVLLPSSEYSLWKQNFRKLSWKIKKSELLGQNKVELFFPPSWCSGKDLETVHKRTETIVGRVIGHAKYKLEQRRYVQPGCNSRCRDATWCLSDAVHGEKRFSTNDPESTKQAATNGDEDQRGEEWDGAPQRKGGGGRKLWRMRRKGAGEGFRSGKGDSAIVGRGAELD